MGLSVRIGGKDEIVALVGTAPEKLFAAARGAFSEAVFDVQGKVVQRLQGTPMQSRTGNLARSIIPEVAGEDLKTLKGRVYSTASYARIHEVGGTISARDKYGWLPRGPYLNIPTDSNKTGAGVQRMSSRDVFSAGGKVKTGDQGFGLYLGPIRMFSFAKQVTIKPQLGMFDAGEAAVPTLLSRLGELLKENFDKPPAGGA
jgi:phage gpG-like protein